MAQIALLGDKDDNFLTDIFGILKARNLPAVYTKFKDEDITYQAGFKVMVDRASYCDNYLKAMVKNYALKGTYVINNPFANICDDKIIEFNLCSKLGIPYPRTVILPKLNAEADTRDQVELPNMDLAPSKLRFPIVLKPHDGYAWDNVSVTNTLDEAKRVYESQNTRAVLLAQEMIKPKTYYRVYYFRGREPVFVRYLPSERRYITSDYSDIKNTMRMIRDYTIRLNTALDYDINACEWAIDQDDNVFLIDAFNETPDLGSEVLPKEYYQVILDRFVSLIEDKFRGSEVNKWPFEY